MGEYQLRFNVARFVLEEGEIRSSAAVEGNMNFGSKNVIGAGEKRWQGKAAAFGDDGKSFKDILLGSKEGREKGRKIVINNEVRAFDSSHGKAIIVRMVDLQTLLQIKSLMGGAVSGGGRVKYLGGLSVLISFKDVESARVSLAAGRKAEKISQICLWEGQSLGFERLAWLKVQGIPLHILTNEVIDLVGGLFGKVFQKADRSEKDGDLSFEYVGVLVGEGVWISEEVEIQWKERKYRVWVMEEMGDWVPDFLDTEEDKVSERNVDGAGLGGGGVSGEGGRS